ncbi:MAG: hypothetical protein N2C14_17240, partial [Planctomycetales bacterium]
GVGKPQQNVQGDSSYEGGAKVTATYETLSYDPEDPDDSSLGTYLTESLSISGRSITFPREAFKWSSDGTAFDAQDVTPGKLLPQADFRVTRHRTPSLPKTLLFSMIGKVNQSAFVEAAAETLLFLGADARREHTAEGVKTWEIELQFNYEPQGHNSEFRAASGVFEEVVTQVGGNKRYPAADFTLLLPEAATA